MSKENKKRSFKVGLVLIAITVLVAVANARAINEYCSRAVFTGLKSVIDSQSVGERL
jgi:hypothetical protein